MFQYVNLVWEGEAKQVSFQVLEKKIRCKIKLGWRMGVRGAKGRRKGIPKLWGGILEGSVYE